MPSFSKGPAGILLLATILGALGCTRWQLEQVSPDQLVRDTPRAIRVERLNGTVVELVRVETVGDSLAGLVPYSAPPGAPLRRVAVPLDQISRVATQRSDFKRTLAGVLAGPIAILAGGFMMRW